RSAFSVQTLCPCCSLDRCRPCTSCDRHPPLHGSANCNLTLPGRAAQNQGRPRTIERHCFGGRPCELDPEPWCSISGGLPQCPQVSFSDSRDPNRAGRDYAARSDVYSSERSSG